MLCSESFGVFKNTVISCESHFDLILGVGYGAASVHPQQPTMIVSCSVGSVFFCQLQIVEFWELWKGYKWESPRGTVDVVALSVVATVVFAGLLSLAYKDWTCP